ncbi:MAG: family 10 glycosylhydrolase [Pseudanabaenales cyanobacterium]|nr:family 10 glycosylhydrolase [Pseudanabaenales cyanobacterium]
MRVRQIPFNRKCWVGFSSILVSTSLVNGLLSTPLMGGSAQAQLNRYCQLSQSIINQKERLRQAAFQGDEPARREYEELVKRHSARLHNCRSRTWPNQQAIWVRLYPCDLQSGLLEALMDRIVNLGYNQVYVEVFYSGQVLLPKADNPTVWPSVVQAQGYDGRDLLAEAIAKGQQRGLQVYAWLFTLNFGYSYGRRSDRQQTLARNGYGQDTLTYSLSGASSNSEEAFVDPYNPQALQDFQQMVQAIVQRRPDGVLFDYIRYPRGNGSASVASQVGDLWIYGNAAQQALFRRALNNKGLELIRRFLMRGYLIEADVEEVEQLYPTEGEPLWQGRTLSPISIDPIPVAQRRLLLQNELWRLSVAHAVQGVIDFLDRAAQPVQQRGITTGAVFFPGGNESVGQNGYDSRLQHWNRFPTWMTWHPMVYAVCGHTQCIVEEVRRVLNQIGASAEQQVKPVIAGVWGRSIRNRPALESQMRSIQQTAPQINAISHFSLSWQEPDFDRVRKFCQLQ